MLNHQKGDVMKEMKKQNLLFLGAVSAMAAVGGYLYYYGNDCLKITCYEIKADVERPIKLVHLSDLHSKKYGKGQQKLIGTVMSCGADLIAVTGDMVNGKGSSQRELAESVELLSALNDYAPVLYVAGNHEHSLEPERLAAYRKSLTDHRIIVLANEMISVQAAGQNITILGMDEDDKETPVDKHTLMHDFEVQDGFRLLLCHYPGRFALDGEDSYQNFCFDLMLAGHSHGGQIVLPGIGGVYSPDQGLFPKYYKGMYGDMPKMIISGGLGPSFFPVRIFNRPEMVCVTISPNRE